MFRNRNYSPTLRLEEGDDAEILIEAPIVCVCLFAVATEDDSQKESHWCSDVVICPIGNGCLHGKGKIIGTILSPLLERI